MESKNKCYEDERLHVYRNLKIRSKNTGKYAGELEIEEAVQAVELDLWNI